MQGLNKRVAGVIRFNEDPAPKGLKMAPRPRRTVYLTDDILCINHNSPIQ